MKAYRSNSLGSQTKTEVITFLAEETVFVRVIVEVIFAIRDSTRFASVLLYERMNLFYQHLSKKISRIRLYYSVTIFAFCPCFEIPFFPPKCEIHVSSERDKRRTVRHRYYFKQIFHNLSVHCRSGHKILLNCLVLRSVPHQRFKLLWCRNAKISTNQILVIYIIFVASESLYCTSSVKDE